MQDILDNTTAVVFVKDLELRYILVNREYERHHQVRHDQIRGKTDFDIFPRDVAEKLRANDRQVIEARAPSGAACRYSCGVIERDRARIANYAATQR